MSRIQQCVAKSNIKVVIVDIMQEHVYAAEIECRRVNLLTIVFQIRIILADNLLEFHQQRTATACRVIY